MYFSYLCIFGMCLTPALCALYANPMDEYVFQWLLRDKNLTIHMLNAFNVTDSPIKDLNFTKINGKDPTHTDIPPKFYGISAVTENDQQVNVEVHKRHDYFYTKEFNDLRLPHSGAYTSRPVNVLAISRIVEVFPELDHNPPVTHHKVCTKAQNVWPNSSTYVIVELMKFEPAMKDYSDAYKWMYFLKNAPEAKSPAEWKAVIGPDPVFERAFKIAEFKNWTYRQAEQYEESHMRETQFCDVLNTAVQKGLEKARVRFIKSALKVGKGVPDIARLIDMSEGDVRELMDKYDLKVK